MSFDSFPQFMHFLRDNAKRAFDVNGQHAPMFFITREDGPLLMIPVLWENQHHKHIASLIIKQLCQKVKARYVGFVVESWMANAKPGDNTAPSKREDREEAIWINGQSRSEGSESGYYMIRRHALGKPILGDYVQMHDSMSIFENLLDESTIN